MGNLWNQMIQIKGKYVIIFYCLIVVPLMPLGCGDVEAIDSDGDGWSDVQEEKAGTNPYKADTDGDGYRDPKDDNPLDPNIPSVIQPTPKPPPIPTPMPTPDEAEAAATELSNIQTAVVAMMVDNAISTLPNPVSSATANMSQFPDTTAAASKGTDPEGNDYDSNDKDGFVLYRYDIKGGDGSDNLSLVKLCRHGSHQGHLYGYGGRDGDSGDYRL